ncbi:FecR domain-containing protein [Rapidithrix thailandica]|uniref:FecR domain-containing protein n=1 Tax=Rapidithrix thailandica TaxID=413964 RepID=A0AAW9SC67_9BACT
MKQEEIIGLLKKYKENRCTPEEYHKVYTWMNKAENEKLLGEILENEIGGKSGQESEFQGAEEEKEALWNKIQKEVRNTPYGLKKQTQTRRKERSRSIVSGTYQVAAAVALLVISLSLALYHFNHQEEEVFVKPLVMKETRTLAGQKKDVVLADGTKVKLNARSSLRFPENFQDTGERRVYLTGEAFFEVTENAEKPFVVVSNQTKTKVLGTTFNVNAQPGDNNIYIALVTGKVLVEMEDTHSFLQPDQMVTVNIAEGKMATSGFDKEEILGWKEGKIVFREAGIETVVQELEKWYGVEFTLKGTMPKGTISAVYDKVSLKKILEGISFTYRFSYDIEDKKVIIQFK